jgi:hypothetical protein
MVRRIAERVGFSLDDSAADAALGRIVDQAFADHETRELDGVGGQRFACERDDGVEAVVHGSRRFPRLRPDWRFNIACLGPLVERRCEYLTARRIGIRAAKGR